MVFQTVDAADWRRHRAKFEFAGLACGAVVFHLRIAAYTAAENAKSVFDEAN